MADMTQPERPERASIPDSEYQSPKKTAEPTHIGITIHRDARATFVPTDLKAHDMGDDVPFSPVDRTSVERLRDEAARLTVGLPDSPQSIKAPPIPMGEPLEPRKEESIPLKVKLAAAVLGVAGAAAGFLGYNKINSGDDGSERPGAIITDPTLEPATPPPTFTPDSIPTPEATQASELNLGNQYSSIEEMPISEDDKATIRELLQGSEVQIITDRAIITIDNRLKNRTTCPDPQAAVIGDMATCSQLHSVRLKSKEELENADIPPSAELLDLGVMDAKYMLYKEQNPDSQLSFEEYVLSKDPQAQESKLWSYDGLTKELEDNNLSKDKPMIIRLEADPDEAFIEINSAYYNYFRVKNGIGVVGGYAFEFASISNIASSKPEQWRLSSAVSAFLSNMPDPLIKGGRGSEFGQRYRPSDRNEGRKTELDEYFVPIKVKEPVEVWNGIFASTGTPFIRK